MKITVSVIKADVGGIGGHTLPSDGLLNAIRKTVKDAGDLLIDHYIGYCGDDSHIVMTHTKGIDNKEIHQLAWNAFMAGTKVAKEEGLYGAGQDLLKDSFRATSREWDQVWQKWSLMKDQTRHSLSLLLIKLNLVLSIIRSTNCLLMH